MQTMSTEEAARRAGVSARNVRRWVDEGKVQGERDAARNLRVSVESLEGFLAKRGVGPRTVAPEPAEETSAGTRGTAGALLALIREKDAQLLALSHELGKRDERIAQLEREGAQQRELPGPRGRNVLARFLWGDLPPSR